MAEIYDVIFEMLNEAGLTPCWTGVGINVKSIKNFSVRINGGTISCTVIPPDRYTIPNCVETLKFDLGDPNVFDKLVNSLCVGHA